MLVHLWFNLQGALAEACVPQTCKLLGYAWFQPCVCNRCLQVLKIVERVLYAGDSAEAKQVMEDAQEQFGALLLGPEPEAA